MITKQIEADDIYDMNTQAGHNAQIDLGPGPSIDEIESLQHEYFLDYFNEYVEDIKPLLVVYKVKYDPSIRDVLSDCLEGSIEEWLENYLENEYRPLYIFNEEIV